MEGRFQFSKCLMIMIFILPLLSFGQEELPPPAAMAPKSHEPLIDSLVEVMDYELIFGELKKEMIETFFKENDLDTHRKEQFFRDIRYYEKRSMFYNVYGLESKRELEDLITEFRLYSDEEKISLIHRYKRIALSNYRNYIKYECEKIIEADTKGK